jgi:hypothetical protein
MAIGEDLDDDMIDELIREADKDGDGQIAFAEFHRLVKELEKESLGGAAIEPMKDFSRKPKAMKLSSSDGSGDGSDSAGVAGGGYSHFPSFHHHVCSCSLTRVCFFRRSAANMDLSSDSSLQ